MDPSGVERLTKRQVEVLRLTCRGCTRTQTADHLCLSPHTIKSYLIDIYRTLGVGSLNNRAFEPNAKAAWACYLLGMVDGLAVVDPDGQVLRRVIAERQPVNGTHRDTV